MATQLNLSEPSDSDQSSASDQSVSSRSSSRVAEKKKGKSEAEEPFVLSIKYFSKGRTRPTHTHTDTQMVALLLLPPTELSVGCCVIQKGELEDSGVSL